MSCYIASNNNRIYAALETTYGHTPEVSEMGRFPAVKLGIRQALEKTKRRDKTGTRTFGGTPTGVRRRTSFDLKTYLTSWLDANAQPGYGPLFQAAMGAEPTLYAGGVVAAADSATRIHCTGTHGLAIGQAITIEGEMRFVSAIVDASTIDVNAPFSAAPEQGTLVGPTITYTLGSSLSGVSLFDYWSPNDAVQRVLSGAAMNEMRLSVNADFHEIQFRGSARDVVDSVSFTAGQAELEEFPAEPEASGYDYSLVPGHMGQVWLGNTPSRFYTLTTAELKLENNIESRTKEFGLEGPRCISAGERAVTLDFELFASEHEDTRALYEASRLRSPIRVMLQLGQQPTQLLGVYMKSVTPEIPEYDDGETRLLWKFSDCRAQGTSDDELIIAFG
jgi:hypothetical protein